MYSHGVFLEANLLYKTSLWVFLKTNLSSNKKWENKKFFEPINCLNRKGFETVSYQYFTQEESFEHPLFILRTFGKACLLYPDKLVQNVMLWW